MKLGNSIFDVSNFRRKIILNVQSQIKNEAIDDIEIGARRPVYDVLAFPIRYKVLGDVADLTYENRVLYIRD